MLNGNPHTRSKADYYARHLFLRVLCHELATDDEPSPIGVQSQALDGIGDEEEYDEDVSEELRNGDPLTRKLSILPTHLREARTARRDQLRKLLLKEKAVFQSILIFVQKFIFSLQIQEEHQQQKVNEISFKAITKVIQLVFVCSLPGVGLTRLLRERE